MDSYTKISRSYGVSIHAIKNILIDSGYLIHNYPTDEAIYNKFAEIKVLPSGRFSEDPVEVVSWDREFIAQLTKQKGIYIKEFQVYSAHSALSRLQEAGRSIENILNLNDNSDKQILTVCNNLIYCELLVLTGVADQKWSNLRKWLLLQQYDLDVYSINLNRKKFNEISRDRRKITAVNEWFAQYRK